LQQKLRGMKEAFVIEQHLLELEFTNV